MVKWKNSDVRRSMPGKSSYRSPFASLMRTLILNVLGFGSHMVACDNRRVIIKMKTTFSLPELSIMHTVHFNTTPRFGRTNIEAIFHSTPKTFSA